MLLYPSSCKAKGGGYLPASSGIGCCIIHIEEIRPDKIPCNKSEYGLVSGYLSFNGDHRF